MQLIGLIVGAGMLVVYFCSKYTLVMRAKGYPDKLPIREVLQYSLAGHPQSRTIVPMKYIAWVFLFLGLFGWGDELSRSDVLSIWKPIVIVVAYINVWARTLLYEVMHSKDEKKVDASELLMLRMSFREVGWFPRRTSWLAAVVTVSGMAVIAICLIMLFVTISF
jgi:hypothetical protein